MATKVNGDGKKPPSAATNLIGKPPTVAPRWHSQPLTNAPKQLVEEPV